MTPKERTRNAIHYVLNSITEMDMTEAIKVMPILYEGVGVDPFDPYTRQFLIDISYSSYFSREHFVTKGGILISFDTFVEDMELSYDDENGIDVLLPIGNFEAKSARSMERHEHAFINMLNTALEDHDNGWAIEFFTESCLDYHEYDQMRSALKHIGMHIFQTYGFSSYREFENFFYVMVVPELEAIVNKKYLHTVV